jgi:hypothetical protein
VLLNLRGYIHLPLAAGFVLQGQTQSRLRSQDGKHVLHLPQSVTIYIEAIESKKLVTRLDSFVFRIALRAHPRYKTTIAEHLILKFVVVMVSMLRGEKKGM